MIRGKLRILGDNGIFFMCPGCKDGHRIFVGLGPGPRWGFNGDFDKPTFTPSVLVTGFAPSDIEGEFDDATKDKPFTCHSFVREGRIQFLGDCTHALAGQTVAMTPIKGASV